MEVEVGGAEVQGLLQLHVEFQSILYKKWLYIEKRDREKIDL